MNNSQLPEGYKQTELGVIPKDWDVVPLGKFLNFQNGVNANKASYGHGIPFINISEVMAHTHLTYSDIPGLVSLSKQATDLYRVYRGDILFNRTSEVQEELGLTSVYLDNEIVVFGGFVIRGRQSTEETLEITYSSYALRSPNIRHQIISRGQGVVRANIGQKDLSEIQICIPPFTEQRAIAQALSDVDALVASLDKLIAKKRHLKTATMQQLLTGKKRLPGFGGKWVEKLIGTEIDLLTGYPFSSFKYSDSGVKLLRGSNIKRGITDWSEDLIQYWPEITPDISQYVLNDGDIVVAMDGSLVGRSFARLSKSDLPALLLQRVARIRSDKIDMGYLKEWICSKFFIEHCDSVKTVTAIPHISPGDIKNFKIKVPLTQEEQRAIATVLSDMDAEIVALETRRAKTQAIKQGMMQELLTGRTRLV
jgi:type I restriction enzyme, S subunit